MTTMEDPGIIDMSGVIGSMLRSYLAVVQGYRRMVTGDPDTIQATAVKLQEQVGALGSVSGAVGRRAQGLAADWEGSAYQAFAAAAHDVTDQVDIVGAALREEADRLTQAASLLRAGRSEMDGIVAWFQRYGQILIDESRAAAAAAVGAFVNAAQQLGNSAVTSAQNLAAQVGQALATLFGGGDTPGAEPAADGGPGAKKGFGATSIDRKRTARGILASQPWFRDWYRRTYGRDPDENHLRMGPLSWFSNDDVLDGRRRPASSPSWFTNSGWYRMTEDGFDPTGDPRKANTPFGALARPPADASTASKLWHDTNINLAATGKQTLADGSVYDARTSGETDFGDWGKATGRAEFDVGPRVQGGASVSLRGGMLQGNADASATLLDANTSGALSAGPAELKGDAQAMVGATAAGHLTGAFTPNVMGGELHLNAFAGAQATGHVSADVAGIGVGATGTLQAGIGAQLDGQAMYQNGHILVNFKAGAALGVGGTVGANIDVDVPRMVHTVEEYGGTVASAAGYAATSVGHAAGEAADAIGDMVHNAGLW